jgi:hypothetical protein
MTDMKAFTFLPFPLRTRAILVTLFVAGMRRRDMSANDYTIAESERRIGVEKSQETTS